MRPLMPALAALALLAAPALAQDERPEEIAFEGGKFTLALNAEGDRILTYDGKELARDGLILHNGNAIVEAVNVAIFTVSNGGNVCAANTLLVWKPKGADLKSLKVGDDCGAPPPAVASEQIFFMPNALPGELADIESWSPSGGLKLAGKLSFAPQPGTSWEQFKTDDLPYGLEAFGNATIYDLSQKMLGPDFVDVTTSFRFGAPMERLGNGLVVGQGCAPDACGERDGFLAVDPDNRKLYIAQQRGSGKPRTWPAVGKWPPQAVEAMRKAFAGN